MKLIFLADFFLKDILGGGELNNHELVKLLKVKGFEPKEVQSHLANPSWIDKEDNFIISNFINLSELSKKQLFNKKYIIYEHDHKYVKNRNPGVYKDFKAPKDQLINLEFYRKAKAVLCQSNLHLQIVQKNTGLQNLVNLGGNLWSKESLEHMRKICMLKKEDRYSILDSPILHKNKEDAVRYCEIKNYSYDLISDSDYYSFLKKMGSNSGFIFFPKTPETLSRITAEARMMNMRTITNKNVGALGEPWFSLKGEELIDTMILKREKIADQIIRILDE
jgi:hypothetical protein